MLRGTACITALLFLCVSLAGALGQDSTLREARLEETVGDREGAAHLYEAWLQANPGSAESPIVFSQYFALERDLTSLIDSGKRFLQSAKKGVALSGTIARIARLFEIAGKIEDARDAYLAAFAKGAGAPALEAAFLLSLEMNDMEALQSGLAAMKDVGKERLDFLDACLAFQKGEYGPANAALAHIADTESDQEIALRALWIRYEIAVRSNDSAARLETIRQLQARFPHSPEYAMASRDDPTAAAAAPASVVPLALPGSFFSAPAASETPSDSSADQKQAPPSWTLSVQAGSFQMKENADDLIGELSRKGFSPTLRTDSLQGKPLYRVLAGTGLTAEDAGALLDRLHQAGFSGFLLKAQ